MNGGGNLIFSEESQALYGGNKRAKDSLLVKKNYSGFFKNHKMHGEGNLAYEFGS